jgi:hypothetical protein
LEFGVVVKRASRCRLLLYAHGQVVSLVFHALFSSPAACGWLAWMAEMRS